MKLTQEQLDFFKDLDIPEVVKHGEGKVQFTLHYNGRAVEVQPCILGEAAILVLTESAEATSIQIDQSLSLFNIEGTENLSGPALLKLLHEALHNPPAVVLEEAWLNTPYVGQWMVDVPGTHIRFSYQKGSVTYELWAHEAPGDSRNPNRYASGGWGTGPYVHPPHEVLQKAHNTVCAYAGRRHYRGLAQ